ncbi:beta-lactamase family protein [Ramlibacter sp. XY19]|uniref:serine hydrolase domain-containing protein n=1 Tax=Ramlibacter paludis TaxID=2908000 RepID=UPI0023D98229|nr:serine hydrolase domain-containing protein [Ramlibacter paludis]MCG2592322.1 beta-lactamase family protein [Ramlibacter paludis]
MTRDPLDLQDWLAALLEARAVPGAALALVRGGAVEVIAAGVRDIESGERVTADTVFDAASLSKPMVAYAVLQLADAGLLDLDQPLAQLVSAPVPDDARSLGITFRHVLTHTGGLQNLRARGEAPRLYFTPGTRYSYSSLGFMHMQKAIEARTGEPLELTLRRLVFVPLGMRQSSFEWQDAFAGRFASPHQGGARLSKHKPAAASASYSLQTTAGDYGRFVAAVLQGAWLKQSTWREWFKPVVPVPRGAAVDLEEAPSPTEDDLAWGLGWGLEAGGSFFQWGKMDGVRAFALGNVAQQAGLALFTNGNTGLRLMDDVAGLVLPGAHPACGWLAACVTETD